MKFFTVIVVFAVLAAALAITDEQKENAKKLAQKCIEQSKATPEAVEKLKTGDTTDNSDAIKAFAACFFKEAGFLDASGDLDEKATVDKLSKGATEDEKKKIQQLVTLCKQQAGTNKADAPLSAYRCYLKNKAL